MFASHMYSNIAWPLLLSWFYERLPVSPNEGFYLVHFPTSSYADFLLPIIVGEKIFNLSVQCKYLNQVGLFLNLISLVYMNKIIMI